MFSAYSASQYMVSTKPLHNFEATFSESLYEGYYIHNEIKNRLNLQNSYYDSHQNFLSLRTYRF